MTRPRGAIYKRNGQWAFRIGYLENGLRREYKRQGFTSKVEAELAKANALIALGKGNSIDAARQTVEQFLTFWFDIYSKSGKIKPSTLLSVQTHIRVYLVPRIGVLSMRKLKQPIIAKLLSDLLVGGRVNAAIKNATPALSNKTVRNIAGTLTRASNDAVLWGLLPSNPCANVDLPRKDRPELQTWNGQQIAQFIETTETQNDPLLAIWLLALTTGMRRGELAGLRWSDIDLVASTVTVTQTRSIVAAKTVIGAPKTKAGFRTCSLDTPTINALAMLKDGQEAAAEILGHWSSEFVATNFDGRPINPNTLLKRFRAAVRVAGLPTIRLHDLRHSYAAYALENGVSVHIVSARLGHASAAFTIDTYAKSIPAADRGASDIVEQALAKLLDERGRQKVAKGREKVAKLEKLGEQKFVLRPYNPIKDGLREQNNATKKGGRGVSNPRPPGPQPGALTN